MACCLHSGLDIQRLGLPGSRARRGVLQPRGGGGTVLGRELQPLWDSKGHHGDKGRTSHMCARTSHMTKLSCHSAFPQPHLKTIAAPRTQETLGPGEAPAATPAGSRVARVPSGAKGLHHCT